MNVELIDGPGPTFQQVVAAMRQYTWPSLAQICGAFDEEWGELIGTGTFLRFHGGSYVLTASHVLTMRDEQETDGSEKYAAGLWHSTGDGQPLLPIPKALQSDEKKDIAVIWADSTSHGDRIPLNEDHLAADTDQLDKDIYFIHGFPGSRSRFSAFSQGIRSTSLPYAGWLSKTTWPDFDPSLHFAITFPATGTTNEAGEDETLPNPRGLSGSAVWKTNRLRAGASWTPEDSRIVGIGCWYDQDGRCLIVSRVENVRRMLLEAARPEYDEFR